MDSTAALAAVKRALEVRDPELPVLLNALLNAPERPAAVPPRDGALTYSRLLTELRSNDHLKKKPAERAAIRVARMTALEAPDAEVPLPERLRVHEQLMALWNDDSPSAREALLSALRTLPIKWGAWRGMKQIFKDAETRGDTAVYGLLAARFDAALANNERTNEVSRATLRYLVRRAWRLLRTMAIQLPAAYTDAAVDVLRAYPANTTWARTWVANHILFHRGKEYTRRRFKFRRLPGNLLKDRAYPDLWKRTPRPLFRLLETADSELPRTFAVESLKTDFRAALREVEPAWVARLVGVQSASVHSFVIWLLGNVPRFEQGAFRDLGLHDSVLALLDSPSDEAAVYAAAYARTHARDLSLEQLIRLANGRHEAVRALARDLLHDRDPRKDVGLEHWGRLLGTTHGHDLAAEAIRKHFGSRELSPEWFRERLLSPADKVFRFASDLLLKIHTTATLGAPFFCGLLEDDRVTSTAASYALSALARFGVAELDVDFLRRALLRDLSAEVVARWIEEDKLKAKDLGVSFLKALAFHPTWDQDEWARALKRSGRSWARDLEFDEGLSKRVLGWLGDVRRFSPGELGFDWLMQLVKRTEDRYHNFATIYMSKAFLPADFADKAEAPAPEPAAGGGKVDLGGKSFLFTGKLLTMVRSDAEGKVSAANGSNASGVSPKLDYLVIGDDGSPLYGNGKKGSKQVAAEKLMAKGAALKIISETAFLQMLAGEQRTFTADTVGAGCEKLWIMATGPGPSDAPLARFARSYLRRHHPDIVMEETERPVDPGAEIPADFLSWDRVEPLFADNREPIRALALELAKWEFARWSPPLSRLVKLSELPHGEVRGFLTRALTAEDTPENKRIRLKPEAFTADGVYRFCESLDGPTRALGMVLLDRNPALAVPEELFRLTESPDRNMRGFVLRRLWTMYRGTGTTDGWKPVPLPDAVKNRRRTRKAEEGRRPPAPPSARPMSPPAPGPALVDLLRSVLFTLPPGRTGAPSPEEKARNPESAGPRARPLPARKAKLALVETLRDLAVQDREFAELVAPLLREFMGSRGPAEHAACLVALARLRAAHPDLSSVNSSLNGAN